jgi:ectoine hydroxylase-related dioxygenase (phytanoyl-CoA dioxygenase family)
MSTSTPTDSRTAAALDQLLGDGYAVIDSVLDPEVTADLQARVQRLLDDERAAPFEPGPDAQEPEVEPDDWQSRIWVIDAAERRRLAQRQILQQRAEFDTPWPVPAGDACISFVHIPTLFDAGQSQRIFNLINKQPAFARLAEHPVVMPIVEQLLGVDAILLDASVNAVGPGSADGGWHVDSPLTHVAEPLPNFTLSFQTVWMLDEFRRDNGATHVAAGSHLTLRMPPKGSGSVDGEVVLEAPAGSLAIWLSQTWHRHAANITDASRRGVIIQYGRCWVKPFVDMRSPITAEQAAQLSPRVRYMMGCNANPPVRG